MSKAFKATTLTTQPVYSWVLLSLLLITTYISFLFFHHEYNYNSLLTECPSYLVPPSIPKGWLGENRKSFFHSIPTHLYKSPIILSTAPRPLRADSDMEFPGYRQSGNVMYLVGDYQVSNSIILIEPSRQSIKVFLPFLTRREIVFSGDINVNELNQTIQVNGIYPMDEFPLHVQNGAKLLTPSSLTDVATAFGKEINASLVQLKVSLEYSNEILDSFKRARLYKSPQELELASYASKVAKFAHEKMEYYISTQQKVNEIELYSLFHYYSTLCGCRLQAYNPIVGAGIDGSVLHFRTGENETRAFENLDLKTPTFILIDAAPEYKGYASDLTRTYVRGNTWTTSMANTYTIVKKTQEAGIQAYQNGSSWSIVNHAAMTMYSKLLLEYGLVKGSLQEIMQNQVYSVFMPHGLGHPIGLDVHDSVPSEYHLNENRPLIALQLGLKSNDYPLKAGSISTIEPGLYFIPYLLNEIKQNQSLGLAKFINFDLLESQGYMDLGGVRIEDVVTIDVDGKQSILTYGA